MSEAITIERWREAQTAERKCHTFDLRHGFKYYAAVYEKYFKYLKIEKNQRGKRIIEVGSADFPALAYCKNYNGLVIEPMYSEYLEKICRKFKISLCLKPVEWIDLPGSDEVWLFNVMQHVINPEMFVRKCKAAAKVIRFFEPVNIGICVHHPHDFTINDYRNWYGDSVQYYTDRLEYFFDADCVYGIWRNNDGINN